MSCRYIVCKLVSIFGPVYVMRPDNIRMGFARIGGMACTMMRPYHESISLETCTLVWNSLSR